MKKKKIQAGWIKPADCSEETWEACIMMANYESTVKTPLEAWEKHYKAYEN